jgi:hypothetical protein
MCKSIRDQLITANPGGEIITEAYLPVDDVTFSFRGVQHTGTTAGYLDLAVVNAARTDATICDWKFGAWSVEPAKNNLQGIAYLLGLVKRIPSLETVTVCFVMPHREEVDQHTFTKADFPALYARVVAVVAKSLAAQTSGTFDTCRVMAPCCMFCANPAVCTKLAEFAFKVGHKYSPLIVPEVVTPGLITNPLHASTAMTVAQTMETWGKAVRAQITAKVIEDDSWLPDGYTFRKREMSDVVSWQKVVEFAKAAGLPQTAIDEALTIRMTPLNAAISDNAARGSKKDAMKAFKEKLLADGCLTLKDPTYFLERQKS